MRFHGIPERKEHNDHFRAVFQFEISVWKSPLLVPRVLCKHGGGNKEGIAKYIREQEHEDQIEDQISFKEYIDPFKE